MKRIREPVCCLLLSLGVYACGTDSPPEPTEMAPEVHGPVVPEEAPLVALSPTELNNTYRDLLGLPMDPDLWPPPPPIAEKLKAGENDTVGIFGSQPLAPPPWPWVFPAEAGEDGFEGIASGQEPSTYSVEMIQKAATHFAAYTLVSPTFVVCDAATSPPGTLWDGLTAEDKETCGQASVEGFAQRAWRRPLDDGELQRLGDLWTTSWSEGSPEEAVVLTVAAILQSPAFLYRVEAGDAGRAVGGAIPLTDYEMASRLSYFLWDSSPDQILFDAAAAGELRTPEQLETQARRLLDDPRARAMVIHFHHQWLETDRVQGISPARRVYGPDFGLTPEPPLDTTGDQDWPAVLGPIRHSLEAETALFVERTIFDGAGTLRSLLTDNHGYMSEASEPLYGDGVKILPGPTVQWDYGIVVASQPTVASLTLYPVELPESERAGLLTLPSVLALGAYAVHPAPILRGKRILERLVCQELGTPPPSADASAPPDIETAEATNRERTEVATSPPECIGCHMTLNPPGFAFEAYDAMGRFRTEDNGLPVDASGAFSVVGGETFTFDDGVDLAHQLGASVRVHDCYTLRWARYATGVHLEADAPGLKALQTTFQDNGRIRDLLVSIATSEMFRYGPLEVAP